MNFNKSKTLWIVPGNIEKRTGIYKYNYNLLKALKKNKKKIDIIQLHGNNVITKYIFKFILIPIKIFFLSKIYNNIIYPEEGFAFLVAFSKSNKNTIIIHDFRKEFNKKNKISITEKLKQIYLNINFLFINKFNKIIVPSNYTKKKLIKNFNKIQNKIIQIPNIISMNTKKIGTISSNIKNVIKYKKKFKIILNISSNETRKNQKTLIQVSSYDNKFIMIIVSKHKIKTNHKIINFNNLNDSEINFLFKISDLYLDLSLFEGFGRTLIEAQYFGLPVLCYNTESNKEIVRGGFFLKKNCSIKHIISKIDKLTNTKINKKKIKYYASRFEEEKIVKIYKKSINEI